jgi:hypothetical protein
MNDTLYGKIKIMYVIISVPSVPLKEGTLLP